MPYTAENAPDAIKELPSEAKDAWIKAYNSAYEQYKGDEEKCAATAWSVIKNMGYKKGEDGKWVKAMCDDDKKKEMQTDLKTYELDGVEIFAVGNWNGEDYSENKLNEIIENSMKFINEIKPPLKIGHDRKQTFSGQPSVGESVKFYRKDNKILANLRNIPEKVFQLLKAKAYKRISCDILKSYKGFKDVLCGISLLGAEIPEVTNLADVIPAYYTSDLEIRSFSFDIDKEGNIKILPEGGNKDMNNEEVKEFQKKLDEKDEEIKKFQNEKIELEKKLKEKADKEKETEVKTFIKDMKGKGKILPAFEEDVEFILMTDSQEVKTFNKKEKTITSALKDIFENIPESVNFKEKAKEGEKKTNEKSAGEQIKTFAKEIQKRDKISFSDALEMAREEHEDIYKEYLEEYEKGGE